MRSSLLLSALLLTWSGSALAQAADGEDAATEGSGSGLGIDPGKPEYGGEVDAPAPPPAPKAEAKAAPTGGGNHFEVHGYFRAPLRVGIGKKNDGTTGKELHAPPHVPDGSFTDWR